MVLSEVILPAIDHIFDQQVLEGLLIFWVASAAVRALPEPTERSSPFYVWFYTFTQLFLANFELMRQGKRGGANAAKP